MRNTDSPTPQMDGLDLFISAVEDEFQRINPKASLQEIRDDLISRCMDRWLILDGREKMFFSRKNYQFKNHRLSTGKRRRSRDPNLPKRALTAYLYFCREERRLLSQSGSTLPLGDITREIAKRWKQVPPEQRQHFEELAAADKQRYQNEMEAFRNGRPSSANSDALSPLASKANNEDFSDELLINF